MQLVIDTLVLYRASEGDVCAIELLNSIYHKCHRISVDAKNEILTEYRSVPSQFVSRWLTLVSSRKIIKTKTRKRCKNILGCHKDMKFVYVCLNSSMAKMIISEDHHFTANRGKLQKKGIRLLNLVEAADVCRVQS